jgi:hypothetical protein
MIMAGAQAALTSLTFPQSETLVTFALASPGGALAAGAVGVLDASLLLYPLYYYRLVNGAIALLIYQRRRICSASPRQTSPAVLLSSGTEA